MWRRRYVICPGHVRSKHDGGVHFINAATLARLYKLKLSDSDVVVFQHHGWQKLPGDRRLYPSYSGDYFDARLEAGDE